LILSGTSHELISHAPNAHDHVFHNARNNRVHVGDTNVEITLLQHQDISVHNSMRSRGSWATIEQSHLTEDIALAKGR
jgi:hypothetical protein